MFRTIIYFIILQFFTVPLFGQRSAVKLNLKKGQEIIVQLRVVNNRFQTAGAQVINFKLTGSAIHKYTVTDIPGNRFELHHELQSIQFDFDGMGQKKSYDSKNGEDLDGPFSPYIKELFVNTYDFQIDSVGNVLDIKFLKSTSPPEPDEKLVTITDMLKPLMQLTQAPEIGPGFFLVFQKPAIFPGDSWNISTNYGSEKSKITFTAAAITDSTIMVDLNSSGTCNYTANMMGHITKTNETRKGIGKIIYDRQTGLLKEKTETIDSNGTTEAMGGTVPINGKVSITILVNPAK